MINQDQYKEAHFYFTVLEFARLVQENGDMAFSELEFSCPDVFEQLKAYMCNKELELLVANVSDTFGE